MGKLVEDRAKAIAKTEEETYETMYKVGAMASKVSADMPEPIEISEREQVSKVLRKAQSSVLHRQFKAPILHLKQVEFERNEFPILHMTFSNGGTDEVIEVRFLDDSAREQWRRGLAYVLHKQSDAAQQWHRVWDA